MKIKKADIVLTIVIIILGIGSSLYLASMDKEIKDGQVIVHFENKIYGRYPLNENQEIEVESGNYINKITIKDGNVQMTFSSCHNQDCVKQGKIKDGSKSIICLPNKVVVEIDSKDKEYDSITR